MKNPSAPPRIITLDVRIPFQCLEITYAGKMLPRDGSSKFELVHEAPPGSGFLFNCTFLGFQRLGVTYAGTMLPKDGTSKVELVHEAPLGLKQLEGDAFWLWPAGHCLRVPAKCLAAMESAELDALATNTHDDFSYTFAMADEDMASVHLGYAENKMLEPFLRDTGTVAEERWRAIAWVEPDNHTSPCYWLTNPEDMNERPKIVRRSLVEMHYNFIQEITLCTRQVNV